MQGRPQHGEVAPYYFTYIDKVEGDDGLDVMRRQLDACLPLLRSISEPRSLHRYAPGKWSIRQVLGHVTDTERAFAFRALWVGRGFDTPLPGYDADISATGANADAVSFASHIEEFRLVRLTTIALFENFPAAAWSRTGIASGKPFSVHSLAFIIPGHVAHHLALVQERYLQS